ncbi:hypothetical protein BO83DRAFT_37299 [Aspergillus eucalypticola CBS 122712]|uniref:Uncharacterized protein n=1 Tax=Aspergillus eucalypticola (strain CBS 122712 / IBT 29274) TaxID=1448314 RepID=A0A317VFL8_ASPEC|nr:uncharacterized protein BO83DRAFT_37299 [Aspergillus eucalypticola CBS 122712]PWY72685.1 hypothetical protein BO83DRAFT_37299 [Aspergillus eucalypticola CBS 122712]
MAIGLLHGFPTNKWVASQVGRMKLSCHENPVPTAMIDRWNDPRQSNSIPTLSLPMICHPPSFVLPNFASAEVPKLVGSGLPALQGGRAAALLRAEFIPGGGPSCVLCFVLFFFCFSFFYFESEPRLRFAS